MTELVGAPAEGGAREKEPISPVPWAANVPRASRTSSPFSALRVIDEDE
eukprot:CAMPEP_0196140942 /NCGR_PEP_ID=MMETSP0910-20130528/8078_1 /TAXON_ID=49265 /ORGANISM="Thalassiosira rotula, Strain GSO102" /LENGTH=48 /DNA_ID= /DNA_START= /DNA_END= /DNA_ORIENTATION=